MSFHPDRFTLKQGEAKLDTKQPANLAAAILRSELVLKQKGERDEHLFTKET